MDVEKNDATKAKLRREIRALKKRLADLEEVLAKSEEAREELKRQHEQTFFIFDGIEETIYISDPHTYEILYCNRALKKRLGKDPTGGKCYREFQDLDQPCAFCTNPIILSQPGRAYLWEYHNPVLDRDYLISDRLIRWPEGRDVRFEMALDITERKRAEKALRERESELAGIFRAAPMVIGVISYPGRVILRLNERICDMLGYREEELVGKSARVLYPSDEEYERVGVVKYRQIRERGIGSMESQWVCKDGRVIDVLLSSTFLDPDDPEAGTVFTALDITEIKRPRGMMEKLSHLSLRLGSEVMETLELILKNARDMVNCDHAALHMLDRGVLATLSTLPGEKGFTVIREKESALAYRMICARERDPQAYGDLAALSRCSGDPFLRSLGARAALLQPVVVEGQVMGCLGLYRGRPGEWLPEDVEMANLLARLLSVEYERLLREVRLKDFIDVASHELRHPVTVIKGYAASLREHWKKLDDQQREELLAAMERGSDRLARMSSKLLDISRIERGRFELDFKVVNLGSILKEAVEEMKYRGFANPFLVSLPDEEVALVADGERLREVVIILLENAVAYSPPGAVVELRVESGEEVVGISVLDRGVGIKDQDREKVFDRFYQVEDALHHSTPGMGMGLYIARETVEKHGGKIWNEPRPGGGTVFHVALPRRVGCMRGGA